MRKMLVQVGKDANIEKGAEVAYSVSIGDNSSIGVKCELNGKIIIGDNVMMGPEVVMYTVNHEFSDAGKTIIEQGFQEERPIIIGNDVWIGRRAIILPGVVIGDGAVIGAGAVVAKDIPPYTVAVGNPVRFIKKRV